MPTYSRSKMVRPYDKSIVLGGHLTLFPVPQSLTQSFARQIQTALRSAEEAAYWEGFRDAQKQARKALGITRV